MKLRNKKTGKIKDFNAVIHELNMFGSLAELNEEWEDYEEPKDFYFIQADGDIHLVQCKTPDYQLKKFKSMGNYFETKEEAEKTVERLKAWKRLKDKGFRFTGINDNEESQFMIYECGILCKANIEHRLSRDADFILLFGGEE